MRQFYIKAMVEKSLGEKADWKAVDAAMIQAAAMAEKVAAYSLTLNTSAARSVSRTRGHRKFCGRRAFDVPKRPNHPRPPWEVADELRAHISVDTWAARAWTAGCWPVNLPQLTLLRLYARGLDRVARRVRRDQGRVLINRPAVSAFGQSRLEPTSPNDRV
jgi:hypothetical protein